MRRTLSTLAALGVVAFTLATPAQADNANTGPVRWESPVVTIDASLEDAAKAWGVSYRVSESPAITLVDSGKDADRPMVGADATKTLERGYITTCVIDLMGNGERADIALILAHEFGHCMGLEHDHGDPDALMAPWPHADAPTARDLSRL